MDHLFDFFKNIRWQDFLDIALNSYILFRLYVLFRGTSAFRVLVSIAIFWISNKLALSLGLVVTSWVIQGITLVAAVIIVVIFRNEIRAVLQRRERALRRIARRRGVVGFRSRRALRISLVWIFP